MSELSFKTEYRDNLISLYLGPKHEQELQSCLKMLREKNIGYDLFVHNETWNPVISYSGEWIAGVGSIKRKLKFIASRK